MAENGHHFSQDHKRVVLILTSLKNKKNKLSNFLQLNIEKIEEGG